MKTEAHTKLQKSILSLVHEAQKSSTLITIGELKEKLKKPMTKIVNAAEDMSLCVSIAIQTNDGHAIMPKKRWSIEDLNAPYHED
jgi:hypothetical protein